MQRLVSAQLVRRYVLTPTLDHTGNVDQMVPVFTSSLSGTGASAVVTTLTDGNELDGTFDVSFAGLGITEVDVWLWAVNIVKLRLHVFLDYSIYETFHFHAYA